MRCLRIIAVTECYILGRRTIFLFSSKLAKVSMITEIEIAKHSFNIMSDAEYSLFGMLVNIRS